MTIGAALAGRPFFVEEDMNANAETVTEGAAQKPQPDKKKKEHKMIPLVEARFELGEQKRNIFVAIVELTTERRDLHNEDYWQHVAVMLKPMDRIEVYCEDGSWYCELMVRAADRLWAQVAELQ